MILSNIKLSQNPKIQYREFEDNDTLEIILDKIKRPFITTNTVFLIFNLNNKEFVFPIESGFIFDGATIILLLVPIIGEGTDIRYMKAALIHDYFLDNKSQIYPKYFKDILSVNEYIDLTTNLFTSILTQNYVSKIRAKIMGNSVSLWQKSIFNRNMWKCLNDKEN